jgi:hypothetical protein
MPRIDFCLRIVGIPKLVPKSASILVRVHGETHFAGSFFTIERLGKLCGVICEIVVSDGFAERRYEAADAITAIMFNDASFWTDMEKLCGYLKPLMALIRLFDHDTHTTEHLFHLRSATTASVSTRSAGSG